MMIFFAITLKLEGATSNVLNVFDIAPKKKGRH